MRNEWIYMTRNALKAVLATLLLVVMLAPCALAAEKKIEPPDVYQLVMSISQRIEHLRWYMGRPKLDLPPPKVSGLSPHEVYFQARTLFEKANRLAFELTLDDVDMPLSPAGGIEPRDVYDMCRAAGQRLVHVEHMLNIQDKTTYPAREAGRTPTDVFLAVVQANRQLNLMMDKQFSPSDVFRQVTLAVSYVDTILAQQPNPPLPYKPTPIIPGKRPVDVYRRLMTCYSLVSKIGAKLDVHMAHLDSWMVDDEKVQPADVFDLASFILSELADIHSNMKDVAPPRKVRWQRGKFPSDVCQRVGVLERQLHEVLERLP